MVFRFPSVAALLLNGAAQWALATSFWLILGLAIIAIALCLGLLTPYSASLRALLLFRILLARRGQDDFHLAIAIVNCADLAVLGPGAYSIDARFFGWRLLTIPPRK